MCQLFSTGKFITQRESKIVYHAILPAPVTSLALRNLPKHLTPSSPRACRSGVYGYGTGCGKPAVHGCVTATHARWAGALRRQDTREGSSVRTPGQLDTATLTAPSPPRMAGKEKRGLAFCGGLWPSVTRVAQVTSTRTREMHHHNE